MQDTQPEVVVVVVHAALAGVAVVVAPALALAVAVAVVAPRCCLVWCWRFQQAPPWGVVVEAEVPATPRRRGFRHG